MIDVVLARRLKYGRIEYGFSDIEAELSAFGVGLMFWYRDPSAVDYLFTQGHLDPTRMPRLDREEPPASIDPDWEGTWFCDSERDIFRGLNQVNAVFLYDRDSVWYYVTKGPFHVKVPLELMAECFRSRPGDDCAGDLLWDMDILLLNEIRARYGTDRTFRSYLANKGCDQVRFREIMDDVSHLESDTETHAYRLWYRYRPVFDFFDDWAVVVPNEDHTAARHILLRERDVYREETISWDEEEDHQDNGGIVL